MIIIEKELSCLKEELKKGFVDPIPGDILLDFLLDGSKFIRSRLIILYLKALNLNLSEEIFNVLAAGELIHSASLLHDDVIDNADFRRGKTSISKKISSKISILSGDYLLSLAIEKILSLKNFEIIKLIQKCTQKMSEAEIKQYFLRGKIYSEQDYIDICKGKTASLFSVIMESCALISNINAQKAREFGEKFGLCFQIKNDLDKESADIDKKNGIYTANDIVGIEKTKILLDNLKEDLKELIKDFPENQYKEELEGLINLI